MAQIPIGAEADFQGCVDLLTRRAIYFDGDNGETLRYEECPDNLKEEMEERRSQLIESLCDFDDTLAEKFLEGEEVS